MPVVPIKADGNLAGDYLQGMLMSYTTLARSLIRRDAAPKPDTVNVVFEKVIAKNTNSNFATAESYLRHIGVGVNCRFLCETTCGRLEDFLSAPLNLLAYRDYTGELLEKFFTTEYGCRFLKQPFPVGFAETKEWLGEIAVFFGRGDMADGLIRGQEARYRREAEALKPSLAGKKLLVVTYNHDIDWILGAALDVGVEVVKIGVLNFSQDTGFRTRLGIPFNIVENYDRNDRAADIARYRPDILLTNYASSVGDGAPVTDTIPMCPDVGFFSGLDIAKRWAALLGLPAQGDWKYDKRFVDKHYSR
jgi:nitrogenase molybdenum-iron protein alpha/beta subunit